MDLGGDQRMKLVSALVSVYLSYIELEMMLSFHFNENLKNIAPDSIPLNQVAFKVVKWAEAGDRVTDLLKAAREQNPKNELLKTLEELLARSVAKQPKASGYQPPDGYSSCLISQQKPLINRRDLRKFLSRLRQIDGPRILTVNGTAGLGKSHSLHLISYLANLTKAFKFGEVDLNRTPTKQITPDQLVQRLALQFGFPVNEPIFSQSAQLAWWTFELADWLARQAEQNGKICWIVLDGFEHPDVPAATHELIQHLVQISSKRASLRLVLLGFREERIPTDMIPLVLCEKLVEITESEVRQFFSDYFAHAKSPSAEKAAKLADEVWQKVHSIRGQIHFTQELGATVLAKLTETFPEHFAS